MSRKWIPVDKDIHALVDANKEKTFIPISKFTEEAIKEKLARQAAASENFHPVLSTATEVKLSQNG